MPRKRTGRPVRRAFPEVYYQLRADLRDLARKRADQVTEIERLRGEAKKVTQDLPTPRYTGTQRIIEVEGTPLLPRLDPEPAAGPAAEKAPPVMTPARRDPDAIPPVPPPPALEPGPPYRPK